MSSSEISTFMTGKKQRFLRILCGFQHPHIFWPRWLDHRWFRDCVNYNPGGNPRSCALSSHTPGTSSQGRTEHISSAAEALMGIKWNTLVQSLAHTHTKSGKFVGPRQDGKGIFNQNTLVKKIFSPLKSGLWHKNDRPCEHRRRANTLPTRSHTFHISSSAKSLGGLDHKCVKAQWNQITIAF